jgi:uncharacterized protein (UPF0332 family)
MSTPSKKDIIRLKISRANTTLKEAHLLLENNFAAASLNRLYYACFYASSALLASKEVFVKMHSGVKQMLGLHFVSTGLINEELGKFYSNLFRNRLGVDYDDVEITDVELVKKYSALANEFVLTAQNLLDI